MKYVTRLMIAFLFCLSIPLVMPGSQSLPDLLKGSGLLILKDNSKGLVEGNVCLDAAGTGTFSDESAIPSLAKSGTIGADDMAAYLADRLDSATVGFPTEEPSMSVMPDIMKTEWFFSSVRTPLALRRGFRCSMQALNCLLSPLAGIPRGKSAGLVSTKATSC